MGFARHESTACGHVNPPAPEFGAVHCSGPGAGSRRCWGSDEMRCLPLGLAAWRTRRAACPPARRSGVVGEPPRTRLAERTTDPDGEVATLRALLDELELERGRSSAARVGATWLRILALCTTRSAGWEVLCTVDDPEGVLREIACVHSPDGQLLFIATIRFGTTHRPRPWRSPPARRRRSRCRRQARRTRTWWPGSPPQSGRRGCAPTRPAPRARR